MTSEIPWWYRPWARLRQWWVQRQRCRRALQKLKASTAGERWAAARTLAECSLGPGEVQVLVSALDDPDPFVQWEVAEALIAQRSSLVLGACLRRIQAGDPPSGMAAAIRVLAALEDERVVPVLTSLVSHPSPEVRVALAHALSVFAAHPPARTALCTLLEDAHPTVRRAAIWALKRLDSSWAREVLRERHREETVPWLRQLLQDVALSPAEATTS